MKSLELVHQLASLTPKLAQLGASYIRSLSQCLLNSNKLNLYQRPEKRDTDLKLGWKVGYFVIMLRVDQEPGWTPQ